MALGPQMPSAFSKFLDRKFTAEHVLSQTVVHQLPCFPYTWKMDVSHSVEIMMTFLFVVFAINAMNYSIHVQFLFAAQDRPTRWIVNFMMLSHPSAAWDVSDLQLHTAYCICMWDRHRWIFVLDTYWDLQLTVKRKGCAKANHCHCNNLQLGSNSGSVTHSLWQGPASLASIGSQRLSQLNQLNYHFLVKAFVNLGCNLPQ